MTGSVPGYIHQYRRLSYRKSNKEPEGRLPDQRDYLAFRSIFVVAISLLSVLATVSIFSPYPGIIPVHAQGTLMANPNPLTVDLGSNTFTSTITVSGFTGAVALAAVASTSNPPPGSVVFSLDSSPVTGSGTVHLMVSDSDFTTPFPPGGDINVTATPTGSAVPTEFVLVGLTLTIPANRAQIVLECLGLIPATPNCSSTSILPFESIIYDANNNGIFDAGDSVVAGPLPPVGTHLANDAKLQWGDANNFCTTVTSCRWASAPSIDPVFYNTNGTVAGRVFLFGPMTTLTSAVHGTTGTCTVASTCADLKLRFAQTDECGTVACTTLQGVVEVKAKLVNVGGILADGSEQDVLAQQIIYSFNPGVLQALCSASPCGSALSGQFDQFCALQSSATGGSVCGSPLSGRFTFVVDSYCTNSGGSVLDTISIDNSNGKISSSSLCSQGPPANNDTGIGCDPNYTDTNRIGTCPGDITKGPAGAPNPPLSNVTSTIVEFIVGIGSTPITNVASAPGVSGSSLTDIDGTSSSNVPVVLGSSSFNNGATHSTTTSVSCLPASVAVNTTTTCTATVTDPATSGIVTPTGTVTFAITTGTGNFNVPTCTLAAGTYAAGSITPSTSCSVVYKPSQIGTGSHTLSASFGGDSSHTTSSNTATVTVTPPAAGPDFTLTASPTSVTVSVGIAGTSTITVGPLNGFTGDVSLTSDNASCSLTPATVSGGSGTSTLSCTFASAGTVTVMVSGTSGSLSNSEQVTYTVTGLPDFTISASPTAVTVFLAPGGTGPGTSTITISPLNGFASDVALTSDNFACALTPATVTGGSGTSILDCVFGFPSTVTVTVTGTSGSLSHSATVTFTITVAADFSIAATPGTVTVAVGTAGTSTITISPGNVFTGDVALTVDNSACASTPTTITGGSGSSTLSCTFSTTGSFVVTVTGTSGSLVHTATVDFTVTAAAGFDLSWQGYDWDGGHEEILYFNGQFLTSLPPVDTPSNGGVWASFSFDMTSYVVKGTNTLTFTHANWDCSVSDAVGNLQVTSGATVVYSNSTSLPLTCTQWLTYTFMVGTAPPPPPPPELSISAAQSTAFPVVGETLTFGALSSGGVPPYMFTWNFGDGATGVGSTVNHEYAAPGTYTARATVTDSASPPDTNFVDIIVTVSAPSSSPGIYTLSWQGYDWDGGQEETLAINGQLVATLPPVDTPSNGGVWASFSFDITSYVVKGTNTLTFTHANWDCSVSDSVRNLQLTNGTTVVYGNATVSPLACSQPLTYTFSV